MKPKIGKGSASPPQSEHDKATSLRLLRGRSFRPKGRSLKPARKIDNRNRYCKITLPTQPCSTLSSDHPKNKLRSLIKTCNLSTRTFGSPLLNPEAIRMHFIQVRSLTAIFMLTLISGCAGYPASYGSYGYRNYPVYQPYYGARYPAPAPAFYGSYRQGNYRGHQPYREHREEYREGVHNHGNRGYGQYRQHHDRD